MNRPSPEDGVDRYRGHKHYPDHDVLEGSVDTNENHPGLQRLHNQRAEHRSRHRADSSQK
jgi:hypothetical protein